MYPRKRIDGKTPWLGYTEPFWIVDGKIAFIGTYQASCHLVDTGDGLLLIDTGYKHSATPILYGIFRLGYQPQDVKYLFLTHWHQDHTDAVRFLLPFMKNAKTVIGTRDDAEVIKRGLFTPDLVLKDGDTLTLGDTVFRFVETPGHTIGTLSVFFDIKDGEKVYHAGMFGGAGPGALDPRDEDYYDGALNDYLHSIVRLRQEKVDLMLGNHVWNNDTFGRMERKKEDPAVNPFADEKEYYRFLDYCEARALHPDAPAYTIKYLN